MYMILLIMADRWRRATHISYKNVNCLCVTYTRYGLRTMRVNDAYQPVDFLLVFGDKLVGSSVRGVKNNTRVVFFRVFENYRSLVG